MNLKKDESLRLFYRNESIVLLLCINNDDLLAIIVSAILANTMGQLHLVALRAFYDSGLGQLPVRTTAASTSLRDFPLRYCHFTVPPVPFLAIAAMPKKDFGRDPSGKHSFHHFPADARDSLPRTESGSAAPAA